MRELNNLITESVKDDAIAMARKVKKDKSPEFQKLMTILDKDRGLMVLFTKWLLGIPTGPKETRKPGQQFFGKGQKPLKRSIANRPESIEDDDIEMPRLRPEFGFERVRPVSIQDLEHLYAQAKEFGLQNFKKNFNEFKNAEEFGDYITKEFGDKQVKDALKISVYDGNDKKFVGIPYQIKKMILETPQLYNLFRNNLEHLNFLADFVARKGMRSGMEFEGHVVPPEEYESKVTPKYLYNALSNKLEELEDFSKQSTIDKIKKYKLNAHVIEDINVDYILLMYIIDATASANLGSQEWCISQAEGFGFGHEKQAANKENIKKIKKATSTAVSHFNNTYQLSKYKKCYFLYDFSRESGDLLRKVCFIIDPEKDAEVTNAWDAKDIAINRSSYKMNPEQLIRSSWPELDQ